MYFRECGSIVSILDKSPFFTELSIKEKEMLVKELLKKYPQLSHQANNDMEVGYEASWFMERLQ